MSFTALSPMDVAEPGAAADAPGPAPGWQAALAGWAALALFALTPLLAYVGNLGFAPAVALAGTACLPVAVGRRRWSPGGLILLALLAWALVSLAWSPAAPHHFARAKDLMAFTGLKLAFELPLYGAFVAAAGRVAPPRARACLFILGTGFALVAVLLLVEAASGAALYQWIKGLAHSFTRPDLARRNVARAAYALALLIWPAALVLEERGWRYAVIVAGAGGAAAALALSVDAPLAAMAAGGLVFIAVRLGGRLAVWGALAAVLIYFALAPVAVLLIGHVLPVHGAGGVGKVSWGARVDIWRFVADRIAERPLQGWGLDASRIWPGIVPLHPHDAALQLWLELGAPGALLAALLFGWLFSWLAGEHARDPSLAAAGAASATAYLVIGALSFGVWQEWWLALGALAWAAILLAKRARPAEHAPTEGALMRLGEPPPAGGAQVAG